MMRILCTVATYPKAPLMYAATWDALHAQGIPDGVELSIVRIESPDIAIDGRQDILSKHLLSRQMVIDGNYDALWSVEADMILPNDALAKLLQVDAGVVYGLYLARSTGMWLCFPQLAERGTQSITANPKAAVSAWGNVIDSQGAGMGCTLIRRSVFDSVSFRLGSPQFHDDWTFAQDCIAAGIAQKHHCGVICGHILNEKMALWPDKNSGAAFRRYDPGNYRMI